MKMRRRCKTCGMLLEENERPLDHIKKHLVVEFFDYIPLEEWEETKTKA